MKNSILRKACAWIGGLFLAAPILFAQDNASLRLQVVTPPAWRVLPEQRFTDLFGGSLRQALSDQGYHLPVAELGSMENAANVPYLLKVTVTDWRVTDFGNITCSFSASLKTPTGERPLGDYANTVWSPGVIYPNGGHAYYPLSGTAIRDLGSKLAASGLPKGGPVTRSSPIQAPARTAAFTALRASPVF
jgi:hypothetical protein